MGTQDLEQERGTAAAVKVALSELRQDVLNVLIIPGDHGYIYSEENYQELNEIHEREDCDITIVAFNVADPHGYGRIILDDQGDVLGIVEQKHLDDEQKQVDLINSGTYIVRTSILSELIDSVQENPESGEFYLTDIVAEASRRGMRVGVYVPSDIEFSDGINTLRQLDSANDR